MTKDDRKVKIVTSRGVTTAKVVKTEKELDADREKRSAEAVKEVRRHQN